MRPLRRFVPLVVAGAVALGVGMGCGDSSGPGNRAASVTGVAGDSQIGPRGTQLPFPLSFVVLDAGGQPLPGVSVTWTVSPTGRATFNPPTSTTDAGGTAATTVTLGSTVGEIVISGTVAGLQQPVTFHAEILDPCSLAVAYTLGTLASGALTTLDCNLGGYYYDFYTFTLGAQAGITVDMSSAAFDTWVDLFTIDTDYVGFNDDIDLGVNQNSRVHAIVEPGTYVIAANSYNPFTTGEYTVVAATRAQTLSGCEEVWITRDVTISDDITSTDCVDSTGTFYSDRARFIAEAGSVWTFTQRSTVLDPQLTLYRVQYFSDGSDTLIFVASNDDSSATTTDAFLTHTAGQIDAFEIRMGTATAGETGASTVVVTGSAAAGAAARAPGLLPALRAPRVGKPLPSRPGSH